MKLTISVSNTHDERTERAKQMGFDTDTVWYHGSDDEILRFDYSKLKNEKFGHFFTDDESFAKLAFGDKTNPSYLAVSNSKKITHDQWDSLRDKFQRDPSKYSAYKKALMSSGFDSLYIKGLSEMLSGKLVTTANIIVMFDTSKIRSVYAKFDKAKQDSNIVLSKSS